MDCLLISPFSISELEIKRALLIFDKVIILDPAQNEKLIPDFEAKVKFDKGLMELGGYGVFYDGPKTRKNEEKLLDQYSKYIGKEISVLNPTTRKFYAESWMPLQLSFDFDTGNPSLMNICSKYVIKKEDFELVNGIARGCVVTINNKKWYPDIPNQVTFYSEEEEKKYHYTTQLNTIVGKINRGLMICSREGLFPLFTRSGIKDYVEEKIQIAQSNEEIGQAINMGNIKIDPFDYVLFQMSELATTPDVLNSMSLEEIIGYRRSNNFEIKKLRRKLKTKFSNLNEELLSSKTFSSVDDYVKNNIQPLIDGLYRISSSSKIYRIAETIAKASFGGIIAFKAFGLGPFGVALSSLATTIIGDTTVGVGSLISNSRKKDRKLLSYFLNID